MINHAVETPPQFYARFVGILYLIIIVGGLHAEAFVRQRLVVSGDPAVTANNILAHELLYPSGFAARVHHRDVQFAVGVHLL